MVENFGFWFWLVLMLIIVTVIVSIGVLVWRSDRRGLNSPEMYAPPSPEAPRANEEKEGQS